LRIPALGGERVVFEAELRHAPAPPHRLRAAQPCTFGRRQGEGRQAPRHYRQVLGIHEAATRADLIAAGVSRRTLATALRSGEIVRARRDRYVSAAAPEQVLRAVRVGGRLTCLALLRLLGVFVLEQPAVHIHIVRGTSRIRSPRTAKEPLEPRELRKVRLHWLPLIRPDEATLARVGVIDALIHSVLCQPARHAIATLDSALNKGLIQVEHLGEIFTALPARYRALRPMLDGRAQSGPETLVRLMARGLGCVVEPQVWFDGIGRVDMVVDGWLVIECDSREFHSSWEQQVADRKRDLALAALGYSCLRVTAAQVMYRPEEVLAPLRGLVEARRRVTR